MDSGHLMAVVRAGTMSMRKSCPFWTTLHVSSLPAPTVRAEGLFVSGLWVRGYLVLKQTRR